MKTKEVKLQRQELESFLAALGLSSAEPLTKLSSEQWDQFWTGTSALSASVIPTSAPQYLGLETLLAKELSTATDAARKDQLETFRAKLPCPDCGGSRLRIESRGVKFSGQTLQQITQQSVGDALAFFSQAVQLTEGEAGPAQKPELRLIGLPILQEIVKRLQFLEKVGLSYLTLDRSADTLSGGEFQRVRLATGIGSGLTGILYILDEPSIGLHPRDNDRLIAALRELQQQENTVLVVEHDEAMMRQADWLIDMGPGAGAHGGYVLAAGLPAEVAANQASITGRYLSGTEQIEIPRTRRERKKSHAIVIEGVTTNNLRNVTAEFPLGLLVGITGVSGSGKSSLVGETFTRAVIRKLGGQAPKPGPFTALRGTALIDRVIEVDQTPIGRSARSNAATYTGVFDEIRKIYAATKEARQMGFKANRFSFNVAGGRCETCQGQGQIKLEMHFLPDLFVPCEVCRGSRFNAPTLAVKFRDRNIAQVLAMPVEEATEFFAAISQIHQMLLPLCEVGLGYLPLGQPSTTISGGEAQRIKLATELARTETGRTLYILDEPTTGLHFEDVRRLLVVLQALVTRGNTVIVVEHHLDVIKSCDWLLDLGPEGGQWGGQLLFSGPPEGLAALEGNHTGRFLCEALGRKR